MTTTTTKTTALYDARMPKNGGTARLTKAGSERLLLDALTLNVALLETALAASTARELCQTYEQITEATTAEAKTAHAWRVAVTGYVERSISHLVIHHRVAFCDAAYTLAHAALSDGMHAALCTLPYHAEHARAVAAVAD